MVVVGRIQGPYGIKGWVHVASFTDPKENIQSYCPWYLGSQSGEPDWQPAGLESIRPHKHGYVAKLSGVDDRIAADAVKGRLIGVPETSLPEPESGEYYWRDLIGAEVTNTEGRVLGAVADLIETGAHDVLVIKRSVSGEDSAEDVLIPFHTNYVLEVDMAAKRIQVDWQAADMD